MGHHIYGKPENLEGRKASQAMLFPENPINAEYHKRLGKLLRRDVPSPVDYL